ncbi:MAG: hypothetical protein ACOC8K_06485 [Gemmatimonadota bacterium]
MSPVTPRRIAAAYVLPAVAGLAVVASSESGSADVTSAMAGHLLTAATLSGFFGP